MIVRCKKCNDLVKLDVILFGEKMPKEMEEAMDQVLECDLLIMIGSSLEVSPAALLPTMAKRNKSKVLFINKDPTRQDAIADVIVRGKAGENLPKIMESVNQHLKDTPNANKL
jgi:NAD-dependent deacetylase